MPARRIAARRSAGDDELIVHPEDSRMINGAHFLLYSTDADADRAFFRDVLGFASVDADGGWLIFKLPPSELAVHPGDGSFVQEHAEHRVMGVILYLMCDDLRATVESLKARDVRCAPIDQAEWGRYTLIARPSGGEIGLYQPSHPTAIGLD
jgi:predicted enzyme related to lactoylglutathione lyase